jgi:hypothetical protein
MDVKTITTTDDPNVLKVRLGEIDRTMAVLASERLFVDKCFQRLLSKNAQTLTAIPVKPLYDHPPRTGWEDSNPLNNQEFRP